MSYISFLRKGDEIILKKGFGVPMNEKESTTIIADVGIITAVTADGTVLTSADCIGITITGNNVPDFELNNAAKKIIREKIKNKK